MDSVFYYLLNTLLYSVSKMSIYRGFIKTGEKPVKLIEPDQSS